MELIAGIFIKKIKFIHFRVSRSAFFFAGHQEGKEMFIDELFFCATLKSVFFIVWFCALLSRAVCAFLSICKICFWVAFA